MRVFLFLWPLRFGVLLVLGLYKEYYLHIFNLYHFDCIDFVVIGNVGILWIGLLNHTSRVAVIISISSIAFDLKLDLCDKNNLQIN